LRFTNLNSGADGGSTVGGSHPPSTIIAEAHQLNATAFEAHMNFRRILDSFPIAAFELFSHFFLQSRFGVSLQSLDLKKQSLQKHQKMPFELPTL
jgi:hypothetical protein